MARAPSALRHLIVFAPSSPPQVAAAIGVHARTARRMLRTLVKERYVSVAAVGVAPPPG
jgi:DNA-binding IclR family transcriptional regulator